MSLITPQLSPKITIEVPKGAPKKMLGIEQIGDLTRVSINSSSLQLIQACGQKAGYSLDRGLVSSNNSPATLFGTAIHGALEVFYAAPRHERTLPTNYRENLDLMSRGQELVQEKDFLIYRATRKFLELARPLEALPETDKRSPINGAWILAEYFDTYIADPYHVYFDENGPLVERLVEAPIYKDPQLEIILFGTIDVVLENEATGQILICDHKTTSVAGQDFYNRLRPNHQYSTYVYLAQQALGLKTDNFLVNCIQVKAKPKTSRGTAPHFPRQITKRSPEDLEEFKKTLVYSVRQYLAWKAEGFWPLGEVNACTLYGGCQYLNICSAPKSIRENIINAAYEER